MKDLRIEKLDPKDMGQYHIRRKVNELVEVMNEIVRWMQEIGDPDVVTTGFIGDKAQDAVDQIQSSDTSTD